ncbi:MAG: hypothetical protein ABIH72_03785 [archaeon]
MNQTITKHFEDLKEKGGNYCSHAKESEDSGIVYCINKIICPYGQKKLEFSSRQGPPTHDICPVEGKIAQIFVSENGIVSKLQEEAA